MTSQQTGLLIVGIGLLLVVLGLIVLAGGLSWFGRLPGDTRIERENVKVYIPLASMIVLSLALSLVLALVRRLR